MGNLAHFVRSQKGKWQNRKYCASPMSLKLYVIFGDSNIKGLNGMRLYRRCQGQ